MKKEEVESVRARIMQRMSGGWPALDVRYTKFGSTMPKCPCCEEPFCEECEEHWADCGCPGPDSEGWYHFECDGTPFSARVWPEEKG